MQIKTVSIATLVLFFYFGTYETRAQTVAQKFEAGAVYTTINLSAFNSTESGGGIRIAYNINDYLAVEAEGNMFELSLGDHPTDDLAALQSLVGVKSGWRNQRFGLFAKLRPGVVSFPELRVRQRFCSVLLSCERSGRSGNRFAVDAGAVLEIYPTKNMIVRIDVGDTMIRFKNDVLFRFPADVRIKDGFSDNVQFGGSVGFRF